MKTRKEKREQEKGIHYFFEFEKIKNHFFKGIDKRLKNVKDPRHQSYVTYGCDALLLMIILKNICNLKSMRSMTVQFNNDQCIENLRKVLGLEALDELPHYDTINDFLAELEPTEIEDIRTYMIKELFKKRCFDDYRINDKYWGVIVDGTGLFSFDEKHCNHCLKREYKNEKGEVERTVYMHHVLEAKLVIGDMVLSIGTEFIENESEDVSKQDCELKAFHRLMKKLKNTYKRLPICILGDSLYACEKVFNRCEAYKWKYILRFKEKRIKSVAEEFQSLRGIEESDTIDDISWVNQIAYKENMLNVIEKLPGKSDTNHYPYLFLTNIKVTKRNAQKLVAAGRSRWKIENEGFNRQKNIVYHIEHASSHNYTAMKNHYLLTQIADILMQLFEKGAKIVKVFKKTTKEISSNLLEAIRTRILTDEDIKHMVKPIQVRFT